MYRYLFGPVPSRRLGLSLGIDLVPAKVCSFDCIFCQVGKTSSLTRVRREYVPIDEALAEFRAWLGTGSPADFITLAGAGEPTLNSGFGRVIDAVHQACRIKTAILSNGSLFYLPAVRADALRSDVVKVSLSGWDQPSFETINRPDPALTFDTMFEGLRAFGAEFTGELWLEVFAVQGVNDSEAAMRKLAALAGEIGPDRIHLNTVVRPPCESQTRAVPSDLLERFATLFDPVAEVILPFSSAGAGGNAGDVKSVIGLLSRHPSRLKEIAVLYGNDIERTRASLEALVQAGTLRLEKHGDEYFYTAVDAGGPPASK